ncbi:MAG: hypothetical protein JJE46_05850 [Acidimicrobiia bacterium]|nr:hypothetical protein [Acidimicrobiia bacterium]
MTDLARNEFEHGSRSATRAAYLSALRWDPASVQALLGLARVDERAGHPQAATRRCEAARAMVPRVNCRVYLGPSG